jgi:23S rRNA pseudouridine1911/1915/1917 synthase
MPTARTEVLTIEHTLPAERLDSFLRDRFPAVSRGAIQRLIEEGHIKVNGRTVKPTHSPRAGEQVEVHWPEAAPAKAQPEDMPLEILHEDDALLVLNKPPGLVVHPAAGHEQHTLVNALLHHCAGQLSGIGGVARPGIVHRLDKETSGCLVVAKNDETHLALSTQFATRKVEKIYQAIVCGEMPRDQGEGRAARTTYRVLERLREATLAEVIIHTGRTHQIRVHFQFIGFPLVGDATYGNRQNQRLAELAHYTAPRQMLHAGQLSFTHPRTAKRMSFTAPLPEDFLDALSALR